MTDFKQPSLQQRILEGETKWVEPTLDNLNDPYVLQLLENIAKRDDEIEIERLRAVVDAAIEVIQDEQVYEGGTTYSLMKMEEALAALDKDTSTSG
jgi:hypothetical protein